VEALVVASAEVSVEDWAAAQESEAESALPARGTNNKRITNLVVDDTKFEDNLRALIVNSCIF
jgi:hypothetical protein